MKFVHWVLVGIFAFIATPNCLDADLTDELQNAVTSQGVEINIFTTDGVNDGYTDSRANEIPDSVVTAKQFSLGTQGSLGEYDYNVATGATFNAGPLAHTVSISASIIGDMASNGASFTSNNEIAYSYANFTLGKNETYLASLNFMGSLSFSPTIDPSSLAVSAYLFTPSKGVIADYYLQADNTGATTLATTPPPHPLLLGPGDYTMYISVFGSRSGTFNLQDVTMSGTATLDIYTAAVPEPASIILWSCIAAGGLPRLRHLLKRKTVSA